MYCIQCKYPLKGLDQHRCPECGTAFHPGKSHTYLLEPWHLEPRAHASSPRMRREQLDRDQRFKDRVSILVLTFVAMFIMYGLFSLLFGPIEMSPWCGNSYYSGLNGR